MGCREAFFRPYLSEVDLSGTRHDLILDYSLRSDKARESNKLSGTPAYIRQVILNDVFDKQTKGESSISKERYDEFEYVDDSESNNCNYYKHLVEDLAQRIICSDPMGTNLYFNSIFGINIHQLYDIDYATYVQYNKMADDITREHIEELKTRKETMEDAQKGINNKLM